MVKGKWYVVKCEVASAQWQLCVVAGPLFPLGLIQSSVEFTAIDGAPGCGSSSCGAIRALGRAAAEAP